MGSILAVASVVIALIAAGCVFYIARELTSKSNLPDGPGQPDREDGD